LDVGCGAGLNRPLLHDAVARDRVRRDHYRGLAGDIGRARHAHTPGT
jgi:hypothetical protein